MKNKTLPILIFAGLILSTKGMTQLALDNSFSSDGRTNFDISPTGTDLDECRGVALQSDGKLVMVGYTYEGGLSPKIAVARLNTDGSLDNTFNSDGRVATNIGSANEEGKSVAISSDGKIYVTGFHNTGLKYNFALIRYTTSGVEDATFSGDGIESISLTADDNIANCMQFQSDGKLLVAGYSGNKADYGYPLNGNGKLLIMRYDVVSQSLDLTFNGTGFVTTDVAAGPEQITCMAIQSDGKIVVGGESKSTNTSSSYNDFMLARYNSDGTLDNSFGTGGIVITSIGSKDDKINDLIIQPNGKIVAVGYSDNGNDLDAAFARYNSDGTLDNSFNGNGIKTLAIGTFDETAIGVYYDTADGVIVGLRDGINSGDNQPALIRLKSNGAIDTGFGIFLMPVNAGMASERPYAMTVQSDGKIVLAGKAKTNAGNNDFFALRVNIPSNLEIQEISSIQSFTVYPNPMQNEFMISSLDELNLTGNYTLKLVDLQGKLIYVYDEEVNFNSSTCFVFNVPSCVLPGIYFLSLENSSNKYIKRIQIQ